jgi:UDP-glucose 6-dehydrogenase
VKVLLTSQELLAITAAVRLDKNKGNVTFFCVPGWSLNDALDSARQDSFWVIRSRVRPGDTQAFQDAYHHIVHMPEFLREATVLWDAINPSHVVIGECCSEHGSVVEGLLAPLLCPTLRVDSATSEMVKLVANAHLSTLISFMNEVHEICHRFQLNSHCGQDRIYGPPN